MAWQAERHTVLADNIANADTPRFVPKDLKPLQFKDMLQKHTALTRMEAERSQPSHISAKSGKAHSYKTTPVKPDTVTLSQNGVSLEEQMAEIGKNAMDYQMAMNIFKKQIGLMHTVLGSRRS